MKKKPQLKVGLRRPGKPAAGKPAFGGAARGRSDAPPRFDAEASGDRPVGNKVYGKKTFERPSFGDRPFAKHAGNGKPFGAKADGEKRTFGRKPFGEDKPFGRKPFGEDKPFGRKPFGEDKPYGRKPFGEDKPFGRKPFGGAGSFGAGADGEKRTFGRKPFGENKPYGRKPFGEDKPYGRKPFGEDKPYGRKPFGEDKPFGRKPFGDGSPGKRPFGRSAAKPFDIEAPNGDDAAPASFEGKRPFSAKPGFGKFAGGKPGFVRSGFHKAGGARPAFAGGDDFEPRTRGKAAGKQLQLDFDDLIYGIHAIEEAFRAGEEIVKLHVGRGRERDPAIAELIEAAKRLQVVVRMEDAAFFANIPYKAHQSIIAVGRPFGYVSLDEAINARAENRLIVMLDHLTDPHNVGAILRTAECAGAQAVLLPDRRSAGVNATVRKAAAGATSHLPIAKVGNLSQVIRELKEAGFSVVGAALDEKAVDFTETDLTRDVVLVIGAEGEGLGRLTARECDELVKIPIRGKTESLNASVAAGILLYEVVRQRNLSVLS